MSGQRRGKSNLDTAGAGVGNRGGGRADERTEALVERCLTGDVRAFETLVKSHYGRVYAYACRMVGPGAADDVTQDVFLRMYRSLGTYRGDAAFTTWLHRIAHNVCIDHMRRSQRDRGHAVSLDEHNDVDDERLLHRAHDRRSANPELWVEGRELEETLRRALLRLSDKHRAVIVLHDMQGFRYDEIAHIVRCSLGTVKSRLYYARRALREELQPFLEQQERRPDTVASSGSA